MPTHLHRSLARLKEFETCVSWMYRDSLGGVAVGVGLVLPDATAAQMLPFAVAGASATAAEIAADFKRVLHLPSSRPPDFYRVPHSPELAVEAIDRHLLSVLAGIEAEITTKLRCYDVLPDGAKLALLDMAYNLSATGLFRDYPRMVRAIETGAWAQAAAESVRNDSSAARNTWTRSMFLSCAVADSLRAAGASHSNGVWRSIKRLFAGPR